MVGLAKDGSIAVPKSASDVGWYKGSSLLGAPGTSVLVGHRSWNKGQPAIFDTLPNINLGDVIIIHDQNQTQSTYIVTGMKIYDRTDSTAEAFTTSGRDSTLRLITCTGTWDKKVKTSTQRLVVFAEKFPKIAQ